MIDKILHYYKKNISSYGLVFRYMKWTYRAFLASMYLLLSSFIVLCLNVILSSIKLVETIKPSLIIFAISILVLLLNLFIMNQKAKKTIKVKYQIQCKESNWRCEAFKELQAEKMIKYLEDLNILSDGRIKVLIDLFNKEIEQRKVPSFIKPGAFVALFIPVWIKLLEVAYKSVNDINAAINLALALSGVIFIIVSSMEVLKNIIEGIKEILIQDEIQYLKGIVEKLEDVLLRLPVND